MDDPNMYLYPALITGLAALLLMVVTQRVGAARGRYKVQVPAITGHPDFERYHRAHMNTLEQFAIFLPALWLCAIYLSPVGASALGALWLVGRILFVRGYYIAAPKRVVGFVMTVTASGFLLLGGLVGLVQQLMATT